MLAAQGIDLQFTKTAMVRGGKTAGMEGEG
jgi:hypothetical protein